MPRESKSARRERAEVVFQLLSLEYPQAETARRNFFFERKEK